MDAFPELRSALAPGGVAGKGAEGSRASAGARYGSAVLVAPPGAGKTTLVPLSLLDEPWLGGRKILVLEPRRLAARAAARRMADLMGEPDAGGTVGYRVRMDTKIGPDTRIEVVTEGVLTRMLLSDPGLREFGVVIFDEFHERSLHADLGLALTLQSRDLFRSDLRLLVMSATLDAAPVAELLEGAPVIESRGRRFEVETRLRNRPVQGWIEPPVAATVLEALDRDEGDVLVFLPGAGEIRRTAERIEAAGLPGGVDLQPLFGSLSRGEQDRAIAPSASGRRKVVLATSIAETSLTIEGVRVVIDAGLMRVPRFDPGTGMTRLDTVRVTRDSADQRRGRAGRTAPGVCYRLWTRTEDRGLVPHRRPEILEADLAPLALDLAVWGATPGELRWLDPPPAAAYAQATELLRELEALEDDGGTTVHGEAIAGLGLHPRLAHMIVRGKEAGWGAVACDMAALLGGRDILRGRGRAPDADLRLRLEAMAAAGRSGRGESSRGRSTGPRHGDLVQGALSRALREAQHLRSTIEIDSDRSATPGQVAEAAGPLAALAYPDRLGRRREGDRGRYLLRNGRGARFAEPQPLAGEEWLVAVEVDGGGQEARIFRGAPLELSDVENWFGGQMEEREEVVWDPGAGRVRARRRTVLGAIVVSEAPLADPDPDAVAGALIEGIRNTGLECLPWTRETRQLRERMQFLHRLEAGNPTDRADDPHGPGHIQDERPPPDWPDTSDDTLVDELDTWLRPFLPGMKSLADLGRVDLADALLSRMGWEARPRLDRLAPTHLEVPSGSRIPIDYSDPEAPALAVRLQEVFGLESTPRIAEGRVPLVMKLLSPAHRPVQVTKDLESFWSDAYFEVRKDMRGRYPKHYWPEDPLQAEATRRTKRRM